MQELNIVDENDNIIGKDTRENIHKKGLLHREVHVWIYNKKGEILFQKRAEDKDLYPGLLDVSVGGHVEIGDDYLKTAIKELEEETGIKAEAKDLVYITTIKESRSEDVLTGMINYTFKKVYAYEFNGDAKSLRVEVGKATSLDFWKIDDIFHLSEEDKKKFTPSVGNGKWSEIIKSVQNLIAK